jgi:hypothetical protein
MWKQERHIVWIVVALLFCSCKVVEQSSLHGFESGHYLWKHEKGRTEKVYVDVTDKGAAIYPMRSFQPERPSASVPLSGIVTNCAISESFVKKSLDIDITTIPLKYRSAVYGKPPQMQVDFNAAIYAGWRHDKYRIRGQKDPLGNCKVGVSARGFDVGLFAGPGTTKIGPFSTRDAVTREYDGFILQYGVAGFVESNIASFGIAVGFDHLFSPDRSAWIHNGKPWIGVIIGFALN